MVDGVTTRKFSGREIKRIGKDMAVDLATKRVFFRHRYPNRLGGGYYWNESAGLRPVRADSLTRIASKLNEGK